MIARLLGRGDGRRRAAVETVEAGVEALREATTRLEEVLGPRERTIRLVMSEQRSISRGIKSE